MGEFINCLLSRSISMTIISLIFLMLSPVLSKWYTAKSRYYAWLIVLCGFILLWNPQIKISTHIKLLSDSAQTTQSKQTRDNIEGGRKNNKKEKDFSMKKDRKEIMEEEMIETLPSFSSSTITNKTPNSKRQDTSISPLSQKHFLHLFHLSKYMKNSTILFLIWICGFVSTLLYQFIKHIYFLKALKRWRHPYQLPYIKKRQTNTREKTKKQWNIRKTKEDTIPIYLCPLISSPMLTGLLHPMILLPEKEYHKDELFLILKHEQIHYQRKDLWYKLFMLFVKTIHWFNPCLYFIFQEIYGECEMSCDEEVLKETDCSQRLCYIETIISMKRYKQKIYNNFAALFYGKEQRMKKRIYAIMNTNKKKTGIVILSMALSATLIAGTICFVYNQDEAAADTQNNIGNTQEATTTSSIKEENKDLELPMTTISSNEPQEIMNDKSSNNISEQEEIPIEMENKAADINNETKETVQNEETDNQTNKNQINDSQTKEKKENELKETEKKSQKSEKKEINETVETPTEIENKETMETAKTPQKKETNETVENIQEKQKEKETKKQNKQETKKEKKSDVSDSLEFDEPTEENIDWENETIDLSDSEDEPETLSSTISCPLEYGDLTTVNFDSKSETIWTVNFTQKDLHDIQRDIGIELHVHAAEVSTINDNLTTTNDNEVETVNGDPDAITDDNSDYSDQEQEPYVSYVYSCLDFRKQLEQTISQKCNELMSVEYTDTQDLFQKLEEMEQQVAKDMEQLQKDHPDINTNCVVTDIVFNNLWFS